MSDNRNQQPGQQFQLELKPEVASGVYSNLALISHSHSDFIVDFARILPGMPKREVCSRVILAPGHAKRLLAALQDNIISIYRNKINSQTCRILCCCLCKDSNKFYVLQILTVFYFACFNWQAG